MKTHNLFLVIWCAVCAAYAASCAIRAWETEQYGFFAVQVACAFIQVVIGGFNLLRLVGAV